MSKFLIIPLVIYPFSVHVSLGQTDEEIQKELDARGYEYNSDVFKSDSTASAKTDVFFNGHTFIRVVTYPKSPSDFGILAHEIFHAVTFTMNHIGMKLAKSSDEAYAYLIGYITERILDEVINSKQQ